MMVLNAKLTNGSECQIEEIWWHLNTKLTNDSKFQTMNNGSECQAD